MNIPSLLQVLFAADEAKPQGSADLLSPIIIVIPIIILFYFMIIRPQKKEQAKRQEMIDAMKKNDQVVTIGGMYGVVMKADKDADEVVLRVDEATGTKIRFTFGAIAKVMSAESGDASASSAT